LFELSQALLVKGVQRVLLSCLLSKYLKVATHYFGNNYSKFRFTVVRWSKMKQSFKRHDQATRLPNAKPMKHIERAQSVR
jgi:hypothetical protein